MPSRIRRLRNVPQLAVAEVAGGNHPTVIHELGDGRGLAAGGGAEVEDPLSRPGVEEQCRHSVKIRPGW